MANNKTQATEMSVDGFINSLPEPRRAEAKALVKLMQSVSRQKPKMWGPSIVGFGSHHYRYESGREGDMPLICFSPRKSRETRALRKLPPYQEPVSSRFESSQDADRQIVGQDARAKRGFVELQPDRLDGTGRRMWRAADSASQLVQSFNGKAACSENTPVQQMGAATFFRNQDTP